MRRADRLIFGALLAVWLVSFGLCLDDVFRDTPYRPFVMVPDPEHEGRAVVFALRPLAAAGDLRAGDRILSANGKEVSGAPGTGRRPSPRFQAERPRSELELERARRAPPRARAAALARSASGRGSWRAPPSSAARWCCSRRAAPARCGCCSPSRTSLTGLFMACFFAGGRLENAASFAVHALTLATLAPLSLIGFLRLDPAAPKQGPVLYLPWVFALFSVFDVSRFNGVPFSPAVGALGLGLLVVPFFASSAFVLVRAYRRSDARGAAPSQVGVPRRLPRARGRGVLPEVFAARRPEAGSLLAISISGIGLLPLCVMVGIVRHNFLDIDRVLVGDGRDHAGRGRAVRAHAVRARRRWPNVVARDSGLHEASIRIVLIVLLIALLVPVAGFLGRGVDRMFFASRLVLEQRVGQLVQRARRCATGRRRSARRWCADWSRRSGRAAASSIPAATTCSPRRWRSSQRGHAAVLLGGQPARSGAARATRAAARDADAQGFASLGSFQRAVLETLGAEVVVPVRRAGQLAAFVCLGAKALRRRVHADRPQLPRADRRQARQRAAAVRSGGDADREPRAPGAPAPLRAGHRSRSGSIAASVVDLGEIEVSVLFVDIRGYSHFAETRCGRRRSSRS